MSEFKPGHMNITYHKQTYGGFMKWTVWTVATCALLAVFLVSCVFTG